MLKQTGRNSERQKQNIGNGVAKIAEYNGGKETEREWKIGKKSKVPFFHKYFFFLNFYISPSTSISAEFYLLLSRVYISLFIHLFAQFLPLTVFMLYIIDLGDWRVLFVYLLKTKEYQNRWIDFSRITEILSIHRDVVFAIFCFCCCRCCCCFDYLCVYYQAVPQR